VLIVEFCTLKREVDRQLGVLFSCYSSSFFSKKFKSEKNVTHRHSQHTACDGVSGVTKEGYHPGVPRQWDRECGKGSTGSVFSFFALTCTKKLFIMCITSNAPTPHCRRNWTV